jgi:predicted nucleic-acid-binding protein
MIGADTNLIIRHLTQDDPVQSARVGELFRVAESRREPVFLGHIVLCEIAWVLKAVYEFEKTQIALALQALLDDGIFHIQDRSLVEEALVRYKRHAGHFSDHLLGIIAKENGSSVTYTFDKGVGKLSDFSLLK